MPSMVSMRFSLLGGDALWEISREMYASATNDGPFGGLP
jgi:hypothetical protein